MNKLCDCGCGQAVERKGFKYIKGHFDISKLNKGKKFSDEHKQKLSLAKKGKPISEEKKHLLSVFWTGKPKGEFSKDHREKLRQAKLGKMVGPKHWRWKGGTSAYPTGWGSAKTQTRKRDGYLCMDCGTGVFGVFTRAPDVHHIDGNKQNCELENLISLCRHCHMLAQNNMGHSVTRLRAILSEKYGYTYD